MPKPPLRSFTKAMDPRLEQSPAGAPEITRVLRHCRAPADCFGANPVASAWATPPGATPAKLCEHTTRIQNRIRKPELSTWPRIGTFYLAPTQNFAVIALVATVADTATSGA